MKSTSTPALLRHRSILIGLLCLGAYGCSTAEAPPEPVLETQGAQAIYGVDDRQEVYAHADATLRTRAQTAVVALIYPDALNTSNPSNIRPVGPTLGQSYNLCSTERFRDQIAAASCSGTLIDDDLVLTAGHCAESLADCQSKYFVFKDYYSASGQLATITSQDVFTCKQIAVRSSDPDYAIIQLDRAAAPRFTPAPVKAGDTALTLNQQLGIIGFGSGIPAKIDNGGRVIDPRSSIRDVFVATTDSFGGNSGSGVFDSAGQVVGILVAGATDYVPSSTGCWVAATYPSTGSGGGETVTYVQNAVEALCAAGWPSARLCGGGSTVDAWCQDCDTAGCPTGWSCFSWSGSSVTFCSKPCTSNADCRSDHTCDSDGDCIPTRASVCNAGDVWSQDSCGNNITLTTDCTSTQTCQGGACVSTCTNACTVGASQCVSGGFQTCLADASGGCSYWGPTQACSPGQTCTGAGLCTDTTTEAWCQDCNVTPCPDPWACFQWTGTSAFFCAKPCASDADCRSDHACLDTGTPGFFCAPSVGGVCQGGDVYAQDACGNDLGLDQDCTSTQTCQNGQCTSQCSNQCTDGARRCVTGGFQTCAVGAQGCTAWSATQACPTGDVCTGSGTCASPDAWCDACNTSTDCPSGWSCFAWNNTNVTFCSRPCASDTDCRTDHRCDEFGDCIPRRANGCYSGDVWDMDSCGNPVYGVQDCASTQTCQGAACVTGCTNQCASGARRCVTGGFQSCAVGAQGCTTWSATQSCGAGQTCTGAGTCTGSQDAWCQACTTRTDCPTGWGCYAWQGSPGTGWCSKPCVSNTDCRADHVCDTGVCLPQQQDACYEGDVWTVDACDNPIILQTLCNGLTCEGAACVSTCTDACTENDTQCGVDGDVEVCWRGSDGCTAWQQSEVCANATACMDGQCVACDGSCAVGERRCAGVTAAEVCTEDAQGCTLWQAEPCGPGQTCQDAGACTTVDEDTSGDTTATSDTATSGSDTSATTQDTTSAPDVAEGGEDTREERVASGASDDCSCQVRAATPRRAARGLYVWPLLLGVGLWLRRRKKGV